jgi:lyso-ornithine lipid O-acyltransferase
MKKIRAFFRLFYFAFYTSKEIGRILILSLLKGVDERRNLRIRHRWANKLFPRLGMKVHREGMPPDFPCIAMGNHRSYLDPAVVVMDVLGFPVSKAEVERWPIIGYGAKVSGVLFLKRESRESRRDTVWGIADKVKEGYPVILFPEGTTHNKPACIAFKPGAFKLAAQNDFPIVPFAIEYAEEADYWFGKDTFLPHFFRCFSKKEVHIYIRYGPVFQNKDAKVLQEEVKNWIDRELLAIRAGLKR